LKEIEIDQISKKICSLFVNNKISQKSLWSEEDFFLITYADTIKKKKVKNLISLGNFLNKYCKEFSFIHILPFFPYSSDDGFAVKDFKTVNSEHGDWDDFKKISFGFKTMIDLVINHCSSENELFKDFLNENSLVSDFFIVSNEKFKESEKIVRPRSSDISKEINLNGKTKYVWCTFSHDQVDFNFKNPNVLIYFIEIMKFYLDKNVKALRLDAVAFIWKQLGSSCINLPQTHDIIRLLRLIIDNFYSDVLIITETNIPSHENLSYFGNNNEAHCIYNFSLAPLLIHSIISGNGKYLKRWSRSMPPAQEKNSYLNFLSSHDGIGLRPLEGILPEKEIKNFIKFFRKQGALFGLRKNRKKESVYEVNITLLDAFKESYFGSDSFGIKRFILAHIILFSMEGIPAVYIQNLVGSKNDYTKVKKTGSNRSINRKNWEFKLLEEKLKNKKSINYKIFNLLKEIISIRKKQPAFHPNATQFTLQLEDDFFGIWRQSIDRSQSIFCVSNLTNSLKKISLLNINLISTNEWFDIISKKKIKNIRGNIILKPYQTYWLTNKVV
jgi:sucrose phosphorylase